MRQCFRMRGVTLIRWLWSRYFLPSGNWSRTFSFRQATNRLLYSKLVYQVLIRQILLVICIVAGCRVPYFNQSFGASHTLMSFSHFLRIMVILSQSKIKKRSLRLHNMASICVVNKRITSIDKSPVQGRRRLK